jgi:two-component system, cell cycle sensor histidine kinase and response regulator CckA
MTATSNDVPPFVSTVHHADADPFRLLVEAVRDYGIFMLDPAGNVSSWNPGAEKSKGYKANEIIGKHVSCFYTEEDVAAGKPELGLQIAMAEGRFEEEGLRLRKGGVPFWAIVTITNIHDSFGQHIGFANVTRDITERKQAEEMLHERAVLASLTADVGLAFTKGGPLREMLHTCAQSMVSNLGAAFARIWTLNEAEHVLELQASAGMYTLLDGPHGRIPVGRYKIGLIAEEKKPHLTNDVAHDSRIGDPEWAKREGMVAFAGYPLLIDDRLLGVIAMFARHRLSQKVLDAMKSATNYIAIGIERKRNETRQRESDERFRSAFERTGVPTVLTDIGNRFSQVNGAFAAMFGHSQADMLGMAMADLTHPGDVAESYARREALLAEKEPFFQIEKRYFHKDGRVLWGLTSVTLIRDPSGQPVMYVGQVQDITEKRQTEQRLTTQNAVISILGQASDLRDAAPRLLQAICETTGSAVGDLWIVDPQAKVLCNVDLWHVESLDAAEFYDLSQISTFALGDCLPGRVWAVRQPVWIVDISRDPNMRRAAVAAKVGLRGGFGFPIHFGNEILGVAEFFSRESRQPDEELLHMFDSLGSQIGQFIERKRAEAEVRRATDLLRAVADGTTDAVFVKDRDGKHLLFNEAAARFVGKSVAEVMGKDDTALFDPHSARLVMERDRRVMATGTVTTEEETLTAAGVTRTFLSTKGPYRDVHGKLAGVLGISRDITDRKRAEEALRQSEALKAAIVESALDCIVTMDSEGRIVEFNSAAEQTFGYSRAEVLGKAVAEVIIPPAFRKRYATGLAHYLATGEGPVLGRLLELTGLRLDGKEFPLELSITPVQIGGQRHFTAFLRDLTQRRRLEEQFRQAQKMEAIGRLAGGVAHDFNNLLTVISGYSEILLGSVPAKDPAHMLLKEIQKAGVRAASLTGQLLAFSRKQALDTKVLDLNAIVRDSEKMLKRLVGEDVELTALLDPALGKVKTDPGQVEQVLMNLVVNARDAMPRGGKITIETVNVVVDETYVSSHADVKPGRYVMLSVSDSGSGMDEQTRARIFEPFFTTKELGKGTGLGLAMVHGFITQSGGHVFVYSEVGLGTTFKLYLPEVEAITSSENSQAEILKKPCGNETILLVEDESAVRALTRYVLQSCGYSVLEAARGEEAIRLAEKHQGPIALLITDVVMPGLGGRMVAERVVALNPSTRVLYLSGYTDDAVVRHGVLQSETAFLQKPFTPSALAIKVRKVLDAPNPREDSPSLESKT